MSDASRAESDTNGTRMMKAMADTVGMTMPERAAFWLEKITAKVHRGPRRDTWTSARDRAAELIGLEPSMAKRIWQRRQEMKSVDGEAAVLLLEAYEAMHTINKVAANAEEEATARSGRLARFISALEAVEAGQVGR